VFLLQLHVTLRSYSDPLIAHGTNGVIKYIDKLIYDHFSPKHKHANSRGWDLLSSESKNTLDH
jgi:hypothetical protein